MKSTEPGSRWPEEPEGMCSYEEGEDGVVKITILDQTKYDAHMATVPGMIGTVFVEDEPERFTLMGTVDSMECVAGEIDALIKALACQRLLIRRNG